MHYIVYYNKIKRFAVILLYIREYSAVMLKSKNKRDGF